MTETNTSGPRPLLISSTDLRGGAGRAALRIHQGLTQSGVESRMNVLLKQSSDQAVISVYRSSGPAAYNLRAGLNRAPLLLYPQRYGDFSPQMVSGSRWKAGLAEGSGNRGFDLVHLNWVASGFVGLRSLARVRVPVVWTLHDMWAFTGGCHYDYGCGRYVESCGACPLLGSGVDHDLSRLVWALKKSAWKNLHLTIVTPSRWLADCAAKSSLLAGRRIEVIPNGLNLDQYRPVDQQYARRKLGLPEDVRLVLSGAVAATSDERKGFAYLQRALRQLGLRAGNRKVAVAVFGTSEAPAGWVDGDLQTFWLGDISNEEKLVQAYAAADVFLAPSLQDNLPNTVVEAMACGTPTVAFDIGGMPDIIEHERTGYLAKPYDPDQLAAGLDWLLGADRQLCREIRLRCRKRTAELFDLGTAAKRYVALYESVLRNAQSGNRPAN